MYNFPLAGVTSLGHDAMLADVTRGRVFMGAEINLPRQLRHDLRGRMNALRLCTAALEVDCTTEESIEFLDDIMRLTDDVVDLVNKIEALPENAGA
jgi:hypothetical protein